MGDWFDLAISSSFLYDSHILRFSLLPRGSASISDWEISYGIGSFLSDGEPLKVAPAE